MGLYRQRALMLAIDTNNRSEFDEIVSQVCPIDKSIVVKVGNIPAMHLGMGYITKKIGRYGNKIVYDAKAAYDSRAEDEVYVAKRHLKAASDYGIDGFIAHGIDSRMISILAGEAEGTGTDIIAVVEMSHEGTGDFFTPEVFESIARTSIRNGAKGIVCPATKPKRIKRYREIIEGTNPNIYIISPGAGTQSGIHNLEHALANGADCPVVGRYITEAENMTWRAKKCLRMIDKYR